MAALHSALTALGPEDFSNVPSSDEELDKYMSDLFSQCEVILESIPPPPSPDEKTSRARAQTMSSIASNASEISSSSLRSVPARPEYQELQSLWGKPIKLSAKDNPLGMSVYKTSGKDGRGAWFARRSVHEGLGYSRWQAALAREFPESLDTPGEPWDGNIRGIGGEKKVEDRSIEGKGRIEVYQLSAKFPGPTTPRDFITLLVTSSKAIRSEDSSVPRHYMIISKPCTHKDCPPRNDYIRGQYESVEFIREVPRDSSSSDDKDADPELNPIEWIMITRSDPGGSVPRFMVERGTPASICTDAVKFLNWATQLDHPDDAAAGDEDGHPPHLSRQATLSKWETNAILAGVNGGPEEAGEQSAEQSPSNSGLLAAVNQGLEAYAPQAVLNYLPGHQSQQQAPQLQPSQPAAEEEKQTEKKVQDDDATSTMSSVSFASAESHVSTPNADGTPALPHHEKELQKLRERRETLDSKLEAARAKAAKETADASAKEEDAAKKAQEKHEKELKKQEEKYKKEVAKLEAKREKENKKIEERKKKLEEKDLSKQNEAMKKEVEALKKERDTMMKMIGALTSENQHLAARLGEKEKSASTHSVTSGGSARSSRDVTPELAPAAAAAALGGSTHKSANSISSVSKDQIRQLIEEENASRGKKGRLRAQSLGSPASGERSRASSRSKLEQ